MDRLLRPVGEFFRNARVAAASSALFLAVAIYGIAMPGSVDHALDAVLLLVAAIGFYDLLVESGRIEAAGGTSDRARR